MAIECHPGYLSIKDWEGLVDAGFSRFSIGIQDFNEEVLHTVNRRPSLEPLDDIFSVLRNGGANINIVFLYGLPHQTADSFPCRAEAQTSAKQLMPGIYAFL